jgi:hypothetical protein
MKITLTSLSLVGAIALSAPALANDSAADTAASAASPAQQCRTERSKLGAELFRSTYGTNKNKRNAFGKCVSARARATEDAAANAKTNASKECTAAETADPTGFAKQYGTGKNGANAHGKCVSQKAKAKTAATVAAQVAADVSAAKTCKALRKADPDGFAATYGTNKNKRNAFGKCVSKLAKAQQDDDQS